MYKKLNKYKDRIPENSLWNLFQDLEQIRFICNQECHCTAQKECDSCASVDSELAKIIRVTREGLVGEKPDTASGGTERM